jgi:hypothetical protein
MLDSELISCSNHMARIDHRSRQQLELLCEIFYEQKPPAPSPASSRPPTVPTKLKIRMPSQIEIEKESKSSAASGTPTSLRSELPKSSNFVISGRGKLLCDE